MGVGLLCQIVSAEQQEATAPPRALRLKPRCYHPRRRRAEILPSCLTGSCLSNSASPAAAASPWQPTTEVTREQTGRLHTSCDSTEARPSDSFSGVLLSRAFIRSLRTLSIFFSCADNCRLVSSPPRVLSVIPTNPRLAASFLPW